jgi:hypothetical protein
VDDHAELRPRADEGAREVAGAAGEIEHPVARAHVRHPPPHTAFQARCRPSDIRSFIRSYFDATESKTPRTLRAFVRSSTVS